MVGGIGFRYKGAIQVSQPAQVVVDRMERRPSLRRKGKFSFWGNEER